MTELPVRIHVSFPGQVVETLPRIDTLKQDPNLAEQIGALYSAFTEILGKEVAEDVMQANNAQLKEDTFLGQLRSHYTATAMWLAFVNHTGGLNDPAIGALMEEGIVKIQLSGDSAGFDTAAHAPEPEHLDDQIEKFRQGIRNKAKRAELMSSTPHDYNVGGMAVIRSPGWKVNRVIKVINRQLGQENLVQLVKHNAPTLKVVAGPREGLETLAQYAASTNSTFINNVSPYWFHHSLAMELSGKRYGLHLAGNFTPPSRLFTYVSYITGRSVPPQKLPHDMADGVWNPVNYYTFRGPSVHGAMCKGGYLDTIVMNKEITKWLRDSRKIATHLMNDFESLIATKAWIMQAIHGQVQQGKQSDSTVVSSPQAQPYAALR